MIVEGVGWTTSIAVCQVVDLVFVEVPAILILEIDLQVGVVTLYAVIHDGNNDSCPSVSHRPCAQDIDIEPYIVGVDGHLVMQMPLSEITLAGTI